MRRWLAGLAIGLLWCSAAMAQGTVELRVTTDPPGADISAGGIVLGTAPLSVAVPAPPGGRIEIRARLPGFAVEARSVEVAGGRAAADFALKPARGRIVVNVADDRPPDYDGFVTLREALLYARGDRSPLGADAFLIEGSVGKGRADDIVFDRTAFAVPRFVFVHAALPPLDDAGDSLGGPEAAVTIMPAAGAPTRGPGLSLGPGVEVANLSLDGFDIGIDAAGFGESQVSFVRIPSAKIAVRATDGNHLIAENVAAAAAVAPRLAFDGGLIEGRVAPIPVDAPRTVTIRVDAPGDDAHVRLEGALFHGSQPPRLYVRQDAPVALHRVPGIAASSSSYEAFRVFGAEGLQHWPTHAVDGRDDYFQWEFADQARGEYLEIALPRPARTSVFRIRHAADEQYRLIRYAFRLNDPFGKTLFQTEIATAGQVDQVAVPPTLDFTTIRIEPLETKNKVPAIVEIEAEILDSDEVAPLGYSGSRVVFPRPAKGRRGIVRLGPRLYAVEDKAFQDGATFEADFASTPRMLRPLARILIESSLDEVRPDGTLTLREAILYLNGELELAAGERTQVEGDRGDPVAMTILAEEIKLASPLPVVRHPDLRIEGRGTRIGGAGAGRPVLSFEKSRQVAVTRLDLSGGIRVDGVGRFEARELVVRDFGAVGIEASGSTVYVARSRFSNGETALRVAQGTTDVVLSTFEGMATGIVLDGNSPSAVIGARFEGVGHPVDPGRLTANRSPGLLLVGNSAAGELRIAAAADPTRGDAAQARPRAAIFAANKPERLGLPEAGFAPNANAYWRYGFDDLRTGGRAAALHHLDFNDPDTACLVERQDAEPVVRYWPHVAILFDTPVTVSCVGRDASDSRVLVPPALAVDEAEDEGGAAVRGTALDQAAGVSVFVQPAASGGEVLSGAPLALRTVDVSDGATIPDRSAMQTYAGVAGIVARLLAAKQYQVAVDTALDAHRRVPGNSDVALLAVRSTDDWARALEAEERYDAAAGLYDRLRGSLRDPAVADRAYVAYLEQHAYNLVQRKSWEPARDAYLEAVALGGVRPQSEANLVYVYQEWARERAKSEPMEKVAAWLDAEADRSPSVRDKTRGMANTLINNAAVESIKSGQFREGLQLASLAYARNPVEATRNNLVYAFQENVRQSLAQADAAAAGATFATVRGRHPDVAFDGALEAAVYAEVKKKVDAGDGASGAAMAARMMAAADTKGLRDIYGYATSQRAAQVERAQGFGPAMKVWEDAARQFPRVAELGAGAASLANREAVRLLQAKQYRESIGVFRRGLTLSPGQATLEGNMKIAYTNWAIEEANARRYADAERVADEGLAIFRGDAKLIEVRDHARRARQGGR